MRHITGLPARDPRTTTSLSSAVALLLSVGVAVLGVAPAAAAAPTPGVAERWSAPVDPALEQTLREGPDSKQAGKGAQPRVRVVVSLDVALDARGRPNPAAIRSTRSAVLSGLPAGSHAVVSSFERIPAISMEVNAAALDGLRRNPRVTTINADHVVETTMTQANALTGVAPVHAAGVTGDGATVAVIDTGIDSTAGVVHPGLADDLLGQACFRTENDCIGGPTSAEDQESHGTHVTGIITGPQGVAPDAQFYALKVFTTGNTSDTNILAALDHVLALNAATPGTVDLVNMSLGAGTYSTQAACDAGNAAYVSALSALNAQGVTVFVATGNGAVTDGVSSPACVTGAVGVGSTGDATFGPLGFSNCTDVGAADKVSCFSNTTPVQGSGELVDVLAPGCIITSTGLDGSTNVNKCGTSMATPYAAGTAALLLDYAAAHSVATTPALVEELLEETGVPVSDYRLGAASPTFPRVSPPGLIGAASLATPTGFAITATTATSVTTAWNASAGATAYRVYVSVDGAPESLAGTVSHPSTTFVDPSPACGPLTYRVRASDGTFASLPSTSATATSRPCPLAPTDLQLFVADPISHALTWSDTNADETGYVVQRAVNSADFTDRQALPADTARHIEFGLACGYYRYRVHAVRDQDRSASSDVVVRAVCGPANDDVANAQVVAADVPLIDTEPLPSLATEEALDPPYSCRVPTPGAGFDGVWYAVTPTANTRLTVSTTGTTVMVPGGAGPDTLLGIFTGTPGSMSTVTCNDDSSGGRLSSATSNLLAGTTYHVFVSHKSDLPAGAPGNLVVSFTWSAYLTPPPNDLVENATVISATPYTNTVLNAQGATVSATDPQHACALGGARVGSHTLWWTFTPPVDGTLDLDTLSSSGSHLDTLLSVLTGSPGAFASAACNDDKSSSVLGSEILDLPVTGGTTYTVYVSRFGTATTAGGTAVLDVAFTADPGVTVAPTTVDVTEGGATDTYGVTLHTAPLADVVIDVTGDANCAVSPTTLTFTGATFSAPQQVTVTAVADGVAEGDHTCTITHTATSSDAAYEGLTIADVTGSVTDQAWNLGVDAFYDADADGIRDAGEADLTGWQFALDGVDGFLTPFSGPVDAGPHTALARTASGTSWVSTTPTSVTVTVPQDVQISFGRLCLGSGGGNPIGFWSSKGGLALIGADDLAMLRSLSLRNTNGTDFDPTTTSQVASWLKAATARNMASMLSAQLAATALNVHNAMVGGTSLVAATGTSAGASTGFATVDQVVAEANAALTADGSTPKGDPNRAPQELMMKVLEGSNTNRGFVQATPCALSFPPLG